MSTSFALRLATPSLLRSTHGASSLTALTVTRLVQLRNASHDTQTHYINEKIPYRIVTLKDPETERLLPPTTLTDILHSIDPATHFLELIKTNPTPIVQIVSKQDVFRKKKDMRTRALEVRRGNVVKEVQMSWDMDSGDEKHKMGKVRKYMEKGYRVDLVYAGKPGKPAPERYKMVERINEALKGLEDVGKEWKPREFRGRVAAVFLQGVDKSSETDS